MEGGGSASDGDGGEPNSDEFDPVAVLVGPSSADELRRSAELADRVVALEQEKFGKPRRTARYLPDATGIEGGVCSICSCWIDDEVLDEFGYCANCSTHAVTSVELLSNRLPFTIERDIESVRRGRERATWFPAARGRLAGKLEERRMDDMAKKLLAGIYSNEYRLIIELVRSSQGYEPRRFQVNRSAFVLRELIELLRDRAAAATLVAERRRGQ